MALAAAENGCDRCVNVPRCQSLGVDRSARLLRPRGVPQHSDTARQWRGQRGQERRRYHLLLASIPFAWSVPLVVTKSSSLLTPPEWSISRYNYAILSIVNNYNVIRYLPLYLSLKHCLIARGRHFDDPIIRDDRSTAGLALLSTACARECCQRAGCSATLWYIRTRHHRKLPLIAISGYHEWSISRARSPAPVSWPAAATGVSESLNCL